MKSVKLIEVIRSWQGEGPDMGRAMIILRFKTCNKKCPWCDTSVKMRIIPEAEYKLDMLQELINDTRSGILVTGGEPTVPRHFDECELLLKKLDYPVANVESNGCNLLDMIERTTKKKDKIKFIFSPKIFNEKDYSDVVELTKNVITIPNVYFKIVYENNELINTYLDYLSRFITEKDSYKVWLMPEGTTRQDLLKNAPNVFDAAERYRFNFSSRTHIMYGFV